MKRHFSGSLTFQCSSCQGTVHSKHCLRGAAHSIRSLMMASSMSHHCLARHCLLRKAILVLPTRGVPPPRECCDTAPVLTRCGSPQQRPPGLGSLRTHRRAEQRRRAAQQCKRIAAEVREVLELYRVDFERVRSRWQQDLVEGIRKSLRKGSVATTGSTLSSLPESSELSSWEDGADLNVGLSVTAHCSVWPARGITSGGTSILTSDPLLVRALDSICPR